jgi:uncharacterized protein YegL
MKLDFGSINSRRLPVYFLIGNGGSMIGEPIKMVDFGLRALQKELLSQPQAMEQVWISLITFSSLARQVLPLSNIFESQLPPLGAGGSYHLGLGLRYLIMAIEKEIKPTVSTQKGDYRPLVFLIFDNKPTDHWERELAVLERARAEKRLGSLIAIGLGEKVNMGVLRQLTDSVLWMPELKPEALHSFFRWTSASVTTVSTSVALFPSDKVISLPKPPDGCKIIL